MKFHPRRFDRAAETYGALSGVQRRMAAELASLLPADAAPGRILEMGCGTGHFTALLRERFPGASLLATDASPRMLEAAAGSAPGADRALFDAEGPRERLPAAVLAAAPFDLIASAALVQWFPDLGSHFRLALSLLAPRGAYLVSGFLDGNFPELNAILAAPPFGYRDFPGHSREGILRSAREAGFAAEAFREDEVVEGFPDARAFLARIQGLGAARRPAEGRPLTRGRLGILEETYRRSYPGAGGEGIRATWRPWYALLRR